ncbi:hypothetical protein H5410_014181 [Solanum commersonii]|uniref:Uncharacterized protein n=1 Tax=Solanum commersonii TaxID=4109 RepID=A0A9J5ZQ71_SOLCO|nr:hypothetical protein H5410_014181 [Solanum commersonii]
MTHFLLRKTNPKFRPAGEKTGRKRALQSLPTLFSSTLIDSVTGYTFRCIGNGHILVGVSAKARKSCPKE